MYRWICVESVQRNCVYVEIRTSINLLMNLINVLYVVCDYKHKFWNYTLRMTFQRYHDSWWPDTRLHCLSNDNNQWQCFPLRIYIHPQSCIPTQCSHSHITLLKYREYCKGVFEKWRQFWNRFVANNVWNRHRVWDTRDS